MFTKVLVAEDHESSNFSVYKVLEECGICLVDQVYYCDDALASVKKSVSTGDPYQLLITDLSFEVDHRKQLITDGRELIRCCKDIDQNLKVIVFSGEGRAGIIDMLFKDFGINGYVKKARSDSKELKTAIQAVFSGEEYLSHDLKLPVKSMNTLEFSNYDLMVLQLLAQGVLQKNIPAVFHQRGVCPNSLSSIEKRINNLKELLVVKSNEQLIAKCKDLGII